MKKNEMQVKAVKKTVLCLLVEVPDAMRAIWTRPDEYGEDGAAEYRLSESIGAEVEAEVAEAMDEGFPVGVRPAEAREAVGVRVARFLSRKQAKAVEAFLDGEEAVR